MFRLFGSSGQKTICDFSRNNGIILKKDINWGVDVVLPYLYSFLQFISMNFALWRHFANNSFLWFRMMALGGGLGSGPSCCSRILVFSVRQTSQIGMPALSLWQLWITFHLMVGSSVLVVFKSQYLFDRVVPALFGFFRSCLWLLYLCLNEFPVLP